MKAWKMYFNEETRKFDLLEFDVSNPYDFAHDPESNLDGQNNTHNCTYKSIKSGVDEMNKNLVKYISEDSDSEAIIVKRCKTCGKYFIISYEEYMWFKGRNLYIPSNCYSCRLRKKNSGR